MRASCASAFFALALLSGCQAADSGSGERVAGREAGRYCHATRDGNREVTLISETRSSNCDDYRGRYIAYFADPKDAEDVMDHWAAAGRASAAALAEAEGAGEFAKVVRRGDNPAFISARYLHGGGRCEVVFLYRGDQYTLLMAERGRRADRMMVWEPQ